VVQFSSKTEKWLPLPLTKHYYSLHFLSFDVLSHCTSIKESLKYRNNCMIYTKIPLFMLFGYCLFTPWFFPQNSNLLNYRHSPHKLHLLFKLLIFSNLSHNFKVNGESCTIVFFFYPLFLSTFFPTNTFSISHLILLRFSKFPTHF